MNSTPQLRYHLGCPAWSVPGWRGGFLPKATSSREFLRLYARVFNTVEGNSTFYALPKADVVARWISDVGENFRFCPKVPRDVSHGAGLLASPRVLDEFMAMLEVMTDADRLGVPFLQLPSRFGPRQLPELKRFLEAWPRSRALAVEVRHPAFFEDGSEATELDELLRQHAVDRVIFDSRALYSAPPSDEVEAVSQTRKPKLPVRWRALGQNPMLRFVGRNRIEGVDPWLQEAVEAVAGWIREGRRPYVFMHTPDDVLAPELGVRFHELLRTRLDDLPSLDLQAVESPQLELF